MQPSNPPQSQQVLMGIESPSSIPRATADAGTPSRYSRTPSSETAETSAAEVEVRLLTDETSGNVSLAPIKESVSFEVGYYAALRAIEVLRQRLNRLVFVGMAGPSGAGKTSLANRIKEALPETLIISMDNYLDSTRQVIDMNFDDFRLIDFEMLKKNILELKQEKETSAPLYDFRRSGRYAFETLHPPANGVVIVEGTYALHSFIRDLFDIRVSVTGGVHFDLIKRVMRDVHRTGQVPTEIIQQITDTVYPMYKAFIEPDLKLAHVRVNNAFNPFSSLRHSSTYMLKTEVPEDWLKDKTIVKSEKYYDIYLHPAETKPLDCRHWIRLRNTNGIYTIMFSESDHEDHFIVNPRLEYTVSVKVLGGLMGCGYGIGAILHRTSHEIHFPAEPEVTVTLDAIEQFGSELFVQVKGKSKTAVSRVWEAYFGPNSLNRASPLAYIDLYIQRLASMHRTNSNADLDYWAQEA